VSDPLADPREAKLEYGLILSDLANLDEPVDLVVGAVAHREYCTLEPKDIARLLVPGGQVADLKKLWNWEDQKATSVWTL
jgi:UDP-N-acetyl-D-galactosamine dehydrogenase